jgi:DNA-binding HxlR family transcriptional regulator
MVAVPKPNEQTRCPMETTLEIIGNKWKPMILFHLLQEKKRFGELQRLIPGINRQMLTQHLRELELHGIVHREVYQEIPPKVEYSLTTVGRTLIPVLEAMTEWGTKYLRGDLDPANDELLKA